ncbi:hypothetical protein N9V76_02845 [Candidatus Poseidoniales archaeon]|nr:hypothetical protein [Candidatus Poseidoniales archaeon]
MARNFGPVWTDGIVFGSQRPGYHSYERPIKQSSIDKWLDFMEENGIKRIICLLDKKLECYDDLLGAYSKRFGVDNVCSAKITDYDICSPELLNDVIIPFLNQSVSEELPTVVHCSAGMGRTGHVLSAWRYFHHNVDVNEALDTLFESANRNPLEAVGGFSKRLGTNITRQDYIDLLESTKN